MKIRCGEVGYVEIPGEHPFREGLVCVRAREVEIWKAHPDAVFEMSMITTPEGQRRYALGSCEIPNEL